MYQRCQSCGTYADDGGFKNERFYCHLCLDKGKKEAVKDERCGS